MNDYTLEFLIDTFKEHSERFKKQSDKDRKKNGPRDHDDPFDLPLALQVLAQEIKSIKESITSQSAI